MIGTGARRIIEMKLLTSVICLFFVLARSRQVALVPTRAKSQIFSPASPESAQPLFERPSLFVPGSMYRSEVTVPVLGPQSFMLKILDDSTARILIRGVLKLDDSISYAVDEATGKISFILTEKTKRVLRRFGTKLGSVGYDADRDEAQLVVKPPLPMSITLFFKRVLAP